MKSHTLKTWPIFFASVWAGVKLFEFRRNDRGFCAGDRVTLQEWSEDRGYTGREVVATISYVLADDLPGVPPIGLAPGFCVFGLTNATNRENKVGVVVIPFPERRRVFNNEGDRIGGDDCVGGDGVPAIDDEPKGAV